MPIGINGSGTITGISAGGLPDATITQADLASGVAGTGPAFSAYQSTGTSTPTATFTKLAFQTEEFDTASCFDSTTNYRFTPNVAGYYQINGCVQAGLSTQLITIYKNGSEYRRGNQSGAGGYNVQTLVSALVYLNGTTDYIELYWYQASGTTQTSTAVSNGTYFQGFLVRAA